MEDVKKCVEEYSCIFLILIQNTRNTKLLDLRAELKDSKLFFGKLRIIALGLGKSKETEVAEGIHKLANAMKNHSMKGQYGLLFTNRSKKQVYNKYNISSIYIIFIYNSIFCISIYI